jgi:magnesium transporter
LLWADFTDEPPEICEPILNEFGFHPLAIDDALQEIHVPKIDDWGAYLYIVLNVFRYRSENGSFQPIVDELDVFLGTTTSLPIMISCWPPWMIPGWPANATSAICRRALITLLYRVVDTLVAGYMPVVEKIDQQLDIIEDQVLDRPTPATLEQIFGLKRVLLAMRRILLPQREVLNKLARDDYRVIDPKDRIIFRDIYDHLVRLHDLNESLRDLVSSALDTYLSVINNRLNDVMKTLTIITTLFMPITFVTGFFGMNFFEPVAQLFGWTARGAFLLTLLIVLSLPFGMYFWMRRRTWV